MTLVSVCIPAYQAEHTPWETVASVAAQTHTDWELVVVDDHSSDATVEIAKSFDDPRIRVELGTETLGTAANFDRAVHFTNAEFVKLLCADDLLHPDALASQLEVLERHRDVVMTAARRNRSAPAVLLAADDSVSMDGRLVAVCREGSMVGPNVLFFHVDNVSTGDFGCYGGGIAIGAETPNVDRFAGESMLLTNYNVEAQCAPTRSALMTGRHSVRTGVTNVMPGGGLVAWEVTMGDALKQLGYRNCILGKWHCGNEPGRYPTDHGFDYWYGVGGTWDEAMWPDDKWFQASGFEPEHVLESTGQGHLERVKVLDTAVRTDIDLEFLEKGKQWMTDAVEEGEPFFLYFNHSNIHFPVIPRDEYRDGSDGGMVADCIQMIDGDFQQLLDKIDELGARDNTIVIFAGDNGRDTSFQATNNRGAPGNWRGGYFSTFEGNNRTAAIVRWPGHIEAGASNDMLHVVDWFPTLMNLIGAGDAVPTDRVVDGVDQSAFLQGDEPTSRREHFMMFFDQTHVGIRWRNFKVLTHMVENGAAPIQQLATPHIYNLTVNPDEDEPYNYEHFHSWVLFKVYGPLSAEFRASLEGDAVPRAAPLDYVPGHPS